MNMLLEGDSVVEFSRVVDDKFYVCITYPYDVSDNYIITLAYEDFKPIPIDNFIKTSKEDMAVYCFHNLNNAILIYLTPHRFLVVSSDSYVKSRLSKILDEIYKKSPIPLDKALKLKDLIDATVELLGQIVMTS